MAVSKLVLIGSGIGVTVATAGGVALYLTSGETLKEHLSKEANLKNQKFIALVSDAETHLQKKYSSSKDLNKPTKDSKPVEKIVDWCKASANIKFSREADPNYLLIANWCFVNFNSLAQEANSKGKFYVSDKAKGDEEWKEAWDTYNNQKTAAKLEISDNNVKGASARDNGGPALHDWCKGQDNKKMYEESSEDTYKRYEKWCFKA